ncbi:MAG: UDP-N-acetylglucosamine 2-epimerase (non-hydrolyzing) [Succinivibrio sp.]|nr:UDP-N-acetylglucosamine 2-epimerase (non-hydrolyzing) [Succinivibrio sp.]
MQKKIMLIFGTRPEAIKMCPLVLELRKHAQFKTIVCLTGQHREMLYQVMNCFGINPDYDLKIMRPNQTITSITIDVISKLDTILSEDKPDLVLVHGDTTSSFAAAIAAFYKKIPIGHVEAGLRTFNLYEPFPEEANRELIDQISTLFFAPTSLNKQNLNKQGIYQNIYITGNTVIDAFKYTVKSDYQFTEERLKDIDFIKSKTILVTAHRRENFGKPLKHICEAIKTLSNKYDKCLFIFPVHPNPNVSETVHYFLSNCKNVILLNPLSVLDMHNLISRIYFVMTDSGGLQEEAPYFNKPVLVLRNKTEREEAVKSGTVKTCGTDSEEIVLQVEKLFNDRVYYQKIANANNPYGNGHASEIIAGVLENFFNYPIINYAK